MRLLSRFLKLEVPTLNETNIRLEYIGRQQELPDPVQEHMEAARQATAKTPAWSDAGAQLQRASEIVDAFRSLAQAAARNGGLDHMHVDEETIGRHLYTKHLPTPIWWSARR